MKYIKEVSVLRKLLYAISFLPEDLPNRWDIAIQFAYSGQAATEISPEHAKVLSENIQLLDAHAFSSDGLLRREVMTFPKEKPLGIILISSCNTCIICSSKLLVRKDRPSSVVVYEGSALGTHYYKYIVLIALVDVHSFMDITLSEGKICLILNGKVFPILCPLVKLCLACIS